MKNIVINRMKNVGEYWASTGRVLGAMLFLLVLGVGSVWAADSFTFPADSKLKLDFTAISGGGNYNTTGRSDDYSNYDASLGGKVITANYASATTWYTDQKVAKTATGNWTDMYFSVPGDGQSVIKVNSDGKSYSWGYSTIALAGTMNSWSTSTNVFSDNQVSISLAAHTTYSFKIVYVDMGKWCGMTNSWITSNMTNWTVTYGSGDNIFITTAGAGTYTFTYDPSSKNLSVSYPPVTHPSIDYCYMYDHSWSTPKVYFWSSSYSSADIYANTWPGQQLYSASRTTIGGQTVYYFAPGDYQKCNISDNGDASNRTGDQTLSSGYGKYMKHQSSSWGWRTWSFTVTLDEQYSTTSAPSDPTVQFYGTAPSAITPPTKDGCTFGGYWSNAACNETKVIDTDGKWIASASGYTNSTKQWIHEGGTATLYAKWTEGDFTVTVSASAGGSVASTSITGHPETKVSLPTATANTGYYFTGWEVTSGSATTTGGATDGKINGVTTTGVVVRANFASIWSLVGSMNSWDASTNKLGSYSISAGKTYGSVDVVLAANTEYSFKIKNNQTGKFYKPTSSNTNITYINKATAQGMNNTAEGDPNQTMTTAGAGTYTFTWNATDHSIVVTYPTSYTVSLNVGTVKGNKNTPVMYLGTAVAGNEISNGSYVATGSTVYFWIANSAASAPKAGYEWWGFYDNAAGNTPTKYTNAEVSIFSRTITANTSVYAVFGEIMRDISTYNVGDGSTSPTYGTAGVATSSGTFTATPSHDGYMFSSWSERDGSNLTISASGNTATVKASADGTLQANFVPRWSILGTPSDPFGGWSAYNTNLFDSYSTSAGITKGSKTVTLAANTVYEIKTYDRENSTFYGGSSNQDIDYAHSGTGTEYTMATTESPKSVFIHSAAGGSYTLYWNVTQKKLAVQYPTSWYITSGQTTEGQDAALGGSFTAVDNSSNNVKGGKFVADNASVTFTATPNTGYLFDGWYTNAACTEGKDTDNPMTVSSITADKTIYAKFVPKTYTVTLTRSGDGYGSGGSASVTATYNATAPAATMPTPANGYAFMGYYTSAGGEGTQIIAANGSWNNVSGYTSGGKWVRDGDVELFAYYKQAVIASMYVTPNIVAPNGVVSANVTVDPVPASTITVCWLLLHSNDNPMEIQPTFTPTTGTSVSFNAPETSTTYKVVAILRNGSDCEAEILDKDTVLLQVAGSHDVTVRYKCGDEVIHDPTTVTGKPLEWSSVDVLPIFGYIFSSWSAGDGVTIKDGEGSSNPTHIKATYDGYLTANYTKIDYIYFKNTMGWDHVDVYFYTSDKYWDNTEYGSGSNHEKEFKNGDDEHHKPHWDQKRGRMTQIEGTDIWYLDAGAIGCADWSNIVFNANTQNEWDWFKGTELVRRGDFNKGTPMFVPADKTTYDPILKNSDAKYYNKGYWINYLGERTGYTLEIYKSDGSTLLKSIKFLSEAKQMPMEVKVDLEENQTYKFQLKRDNNIIYGNDGTMTYENHGQVQPWKFESGKGKCTFTSTVAGEYTFHLTYSKVASDDEYHLRIGIDIPIKSGDYRVIYKDNVHTKWHPSAVVPQVNNGKDTVSFFIRPGNSPQMKIQQATVNGSTGAISWSAGTDITTSLSGLTKDSVYNICLQMNGSGAISVEDVEVYTGNFYIRTNAANNKWDNYRSSDHLMTYSEYSIIHGGYSHYFCHWITSGDEARKNVTFCVANDYSPCISDTLIRETASGEWANIGSFIDESGNLLRNANVRFTWYQHDNTIRRAYLDPAKNDDNFLVLASADSKIANESEVVQTSVVFSDNENWIYEANVKAKPGAQIKLVATWGDATTIVQYFKGSSTTTETLITGSTDEWYNIRLIYDYKTNRLIAAMLPSGNITGNEPINADVMFIREHQGDISQVTFSGSGKLTNIEIAYGIMRFNKWTLNNKSKEAGHSPLAEPKSVYERAMYFISFPFEVKLSEVFGFGTYGVDWIIEYYDGAERARTGWWENQPGFWRYIWNRKDFVLKPNVGYLLELELDNFAESSSFWQNDNERLELFFPSSGNLGTIQNTTVNCTIPEHACTIDRHKTEGLPDTGNPRTSYNRTIFDSHWNVMSVPTYVNATPTDFKNTTWTTKIGPKFLYTWNMDDNTLTATSGAGYNYHAMHAYMVQYGGVVQWVTSSSPSSIVARRTYSEEPKEIEFRLEIQQNEKMVDQTFVTMSNDEEVSADFQFGEDMSKEFNTRNANIFTKIGNTFAAGNTLPMSEMTTIVPVGVETKKAGDYTISIPEGTQGIGITLVDEETGVRTNLSALDYTINLPAGTHDNRFFLEISPIHNAPTGIEEVSGNGLPTTEARKVLIDGILYIVKDGQLFDATGKRVE